MVHLEPFVHLYVLFAGISSALVGISEIRDLTKNKFGEKFTKTTKIIQEEILPNFNMVSQQYETMGKIDFKKFSIPKDMIDVAEKNNQKLPKIKHWKENCEQRFNLDNENRKLDKIIYSLCTISFLFSISILFSIASMSGGNNLFSEHMVFRFIAHLEFLIVPFMLWLFIFIHKERYKKISCFTFTIIVYLIFILISYLITNFINKHFEIYKISILYSSLIICVFPIGAIYFRTFIMWWFRFKKFREKSDEYKITLQKCKENNGYLLNSIINPTTQASTVTS